MFDKADLLRLAEWQPIAEGFGLDSDVYASKILPVFRAIELFERSEVRIITDGGLSNYASSFVHNRRNDSGKIEGLYIYLSLLGPFAALGRDVAYVSGKSHGHSMIEPKNVLTYNDLINNFEKNVWEKIESGGYRLLSPQDANALLPADVLPYEYCLNAEPWNRVFHVLFSDTD